MGMNNTPERLRVPRPTSVLASFEGAEDPAAWLSLVARGIYPSDVGSADPMERSLMLRFTDVLVRWGTPQLKERVSQAGGEILKAWTEQCGSDNRLAGTERKALDELMLIFECIPARPDISTRLYNLISCQDFDKSSKENRRLRRMAIIALAISNHPDMSREKLESFFAEEMKDKMFALAAFAGLRRISSEIGIKHLRDLFEVVKDDQIAWRLGVNMFCDQGDVIREMVLKEISEWPIDIRSLAETEIERRAKL